MPEIPSWPCKRNRGTGIKQALTKGESVSNATSNQMEECHNIRYVIVNICPPFDPQSNNLLLLIRNYWTFSLGYYHPLVPLITHNHNQHFSFCNNWQLISKYLSCLWIGFILIESIWVWIAVKFWQITSYQTLNTR